MIIHSITGSGRIDKWRPGALDKQGKLIYNEYNIIMVINKMSTLETFTTSLKQAGMRLTPQRIAICRLLGGSGEHPTAAGIHRQLQAQYPSLSLMTVYNTLNTLVDLGVVNMLGYAGDDNVHYDADTSPHINLACISCHRILDIPCESIADLKREVGRSSGFKVQGARVLFYGLCPKCQGANVKNQNSTPRRKS